MLSRHTFEALGTTNTVVVDDPSALDAAAGVVRETLREVDEACSRFRADSELSQLNRRAGTERVRVSRLLEQALVAALDAAAMTGGLVDPTLGGQIQDLGYTVDFRDLPRDGPALQLRVRRVAGWRTLDYDAESHTVRIPEGVSIDLGATGKAWAADLSAERVTEALHVSVLVDCGGDVAMRGPAPRGGWPVRVASDVDSPDGQDVALFDGGLATSGTTARRWRRGGVELHHIIDPSTGLPAQTRWKMATVAAATCVEANAASTAALILDGAALGWLESHHLPARLVALDGSIQFAGGWGG